MIERRVTNATSSVLLKVLSKSFQMKLCRAYTMMTMMMISKRWLLCGEISWIEYDCIGACMCVCVYVCCRDFFSSCVAFNSIIQWCISQIYGTNTHTCACIHIHWDTHTYGHKRAPWSKHFYLCCSIYDDYCLFLLYYYYQSFMKNNVKPEKSTQFMPLNMICQL